MGWVNNLFPTCDIQRFNVNFLTDRHFLMKLSVLFSYCGFFGSRKFA